MNLDFIERLGLYFFFSVGLVAIPFFLWATGVTLLQVDAGRSFAPLILIGIFATNMIFSHKILGRTSLMYANICLLIALSSYTVMYVLARWVSDWTSIGAIGIGCTILFWELSIYILRKMNSR